MARTLGKGESNNKSNNGVSLRENGRRSRKRLGSVLVRRREVFRVKMHHGMGGSTSDRHGVQNPTMQARNGVCDKIENYISELGRWYVSKREGGRPRRSQEPLCVFRLVPPCRVRGDRRKGANDPGMNVADV